MPKNESPEYFQTKDRFIAGYLFLNGLEADLERRPHPKRPERDEVWFLFFPYEAALNMHYRYLQSRESLYAEAVKNAGRIAQDPAITRYKLNP